MQVLHCTYTKKAVWIVGWSSIIPLKFNIVYICVFGFPFVGNKMMLLKKTMLFLNKVIGVTGVASHDCSYGFGDTTTISIILKFRIDLKYIARFEINILFCHCDFKTKLNVNPGNKKTHSLLWNFTYKSIDWWDNIFTITKIIYSHYETNWLKIYNLEMKLLHLIETVVYLFM